jgi:predicted DNA-binding transcriptional regulator AlpA
VKAELLDIKALAARWGVTRAVIYGMRYRGQAPPAVHVGRGLRWKLEEVEAWEAEHLDNGGTTPRFVGAGR